MAATINSLLSERLQVKELGPGEVKVFRRNLMGKIDPKTNEPYILSDWWQIGKAMILDPETKKNILLLNVTGERPVDNPDGTIRFEPIVELIMWDERGEIICTENDFEKMCFLVRSNKNESNPFRNKRQKPWFYEVDKAKAIKADLDEFDLMIDVAQYVRDADMIEIKLIASKLSIKSETALLRTEILSLVKEGRARDVVALSDDRKTKTLIQVKDAQVYGVIVYNEDHRSWHFSNKLDKTILEVPIDKDSVAALVEFLMVKEGYGQYAMLAKQVKDLF